MARKGQKTFKYKDIEETLTEETRGINKEFFSLYKKADSYMSVLGYLYHLITKKDAKYLTKNDYDYVYSKIIEDNIKGSKSTYLKSYFEYIFSNDILENETGFEEFGPKKKLKERFQRQKTSKPKQHKENTEKKDILNIEEIQSLQDLLSIPTKRDSSIKSLITWYLLFETDVSVEYLRTISKQRYYNEGILDEKNQQIKLPELFLEFWSEFYKKKNFNGFYEIDKYVKNLGEQIGIDNLTPMKIIATREANKIPCGNCGSFFRNTIENWVSINGRLLCNNCANNLKKNSNLNIVNIENEKMQTTTDIQPSFYSFDELKKKFLKTDYIKKHKRQIEIGDLGQAYALDKEYEKLKDTDYSGFIEDRSLNENYGYDILSFEEDGTQLFIEVKTTAGVELPFYMSEHERQVAQDFLKKGKKYVIYRIENILAENKEDIILTKICDIFDKTYSFEPFSWRVHLTNPSSS